jgi:hypothetical protein
MQRQIWALAKPATVLFAQFGACVCAPHAFAALGAVKATAHKVQVYTLAKKNRNFENFVTPQKRR